MKNTLGIILIVLGLAIVVLGGSTFKTREKVVDLGPIQASREKSHQIPYAPIAGALVAVGGVVLLVTGRK